MSERRKILVVQGANMERLGEREPELYGSTTLSELHAMLTEHADGQGITLSFAVTNLEGEAIGAIFAALREGCAGILINPAGFLHAGYALRDCLAGVRARVPVVEVHITNIERRGFKSVTAGAVTGMIAGFGLQSYTLGLDALVELAGTGTVRSG